MTTIVLDMPLDELHPSPFQHRKVFKNLDELAASIKARGVLMPITARPNKKDKEIVFGERRWRAAQLAGLKTIPTIVREMTDEEVITEQIIENTQRADVHPLEEAEGYKQLLDKHLSSIDQLVAKTGKSRSSIYARLELCKLAPVPRKAFLEDELNASLALMIARIPDPKLQAKATAEVLGVAHEQDLEGIRSYRDVVDPSDPKQKRERQPLSVREAQVHLQTKYMLRLDKAPFDTKDKTLVPKAGDCSGCVHRTGNQPDLFSDVRSPDVCTRPSCYEDKKKADWDRKAAAATRAGLRVLTERETKNVFQSYGDGTYIEHNSPYVDPNDKLPYELDPTNRKTWKSLLGTKEPAKALALDNTGAARTLWDRKSAIAVATKAGKLKEAKEEAKARSRYGDDYGAQQRKREKAAKQRRETVAIALGKINEKAAGDLAMPRPFWLFVTASLIEMLGEDELRALCKRRGIKTTLGQGQARKEMGAIAGKANIAESRGLVIEMLASYHSAGGVWNNSLGKNFLAACALYKVEYKKLAARAAREAKATKATKSAAKS